VFEAIGGYVPHKAGGIDWIAVATARMRGWKTRSFREKSVLPSPKPRSTRRTRPARLGLLSYGEKDYYLGGHPLWELFRVAYRMSKRPYAVEGLAVGSGICGPPCAESLDRFRLSSCASLAGTDAKTENDMRSAVTFKRLDNFQITSN